MGYPLQFGLDVVHDFLGAHPRGWEWVRQVLFLRTEHVARIFCTNQKCWYELKKQVKRYDQVMERTKIPRTFPEKLPEALGRLWALLQQSDYDCTDVTDIYAFPLHQPSETTKQMCSGSKKDTKS